MNIAFRKAPRINELLKSAFNKKVAISNMVDDIHEISSMRSVELGTKLDQKA